MKRERKEKDWAVRVINKLTIYIKDLIDPEKIILFGSYAHGVPDKDSDIDILIVKEIEEEGQKRSFRRILRKNIPPLGIGKDFIIITPQELENYRDIIGTVIYPAVRQGKVLYERRN